MKPFARGMAGKGVSGAAAAYAAALVVVVGTKITPPPVSEDLHVAEWVRL